MLILGMPPLEILKICPPEIESGSSSVDENYHETVKLMVGDYV